MTTEERREAVANALSKGAEAGRAGDLRGFWVNVSEAMILLGPLGVVDEAVIKQIGPEMAQLAEKHGKSMPNAYQRVDVGLSGPTDFKRTYGAKPE